MSLTTWWLEGNKHINKYSWIGHSMAYLYEDFEKKTGIFIKLMSLRQFLAINGEDTKISQTKKIRVKYNRKLLKNNRPV